MNKKIICLGLASMLVMISVVSISSAKVTKLSEINVPEDYPTIQDAIDASGEGDTILVSSGEYHENIDIGKRLSVIGDGSGSTSIIGDGNSPVVCISGIMAGGVTLQGFTIKGGSIDNCGIYLASHYNTIKNNVIKENNNGLYLLSTGNQIIDNQIIENNENGIITSGAHENDIIGNTINSNDNCGIILEISSLSNHICENTISDNNNIGLKLMETSFGNEIYHNNFIGNSIHASVSGGGENNQFDKQQEGNYWDDWDGSGVYEIEGGAVDNYPLSEPYQGENSAPNTPTITGKKSGKTGNEYTYTASTKDPDGDTIEYYFDWDDGTDSGWQSSNTAKHTWNSDDTYTVKVKAKDSHGAESDWGTLEVTMPKTSNSIIDMIENMLDNFDWPFPILRVMLWALGK